jgi:hypothetical protein
VEVVSNAISKTELLHLLSGTAKKLKFSRILTASPNAGWAHKRSLACGWFFFKNSMAGKF